MGANDHQEAAASQGTIRVAIVTVTDSRTESDDVSGDTAAKLVEQFEHEVTSRSLIPNDSTRIRAALDQLVADTSVQAAIFVGGTGIRPKDLTVEVIRPRFDREVPGFGELFRNLSYADVGAAAMLSRACLGIIDGKPVVITPGSTGAVQLALEQLFLPQLRHMTWDLNR